MLRLSPGCNVGTLSLRNKFDKKGCRLVGITQCTTLESTWETADMKKMKIIFDWNAEEEEKFNRVVVNF